MKNRSSKKQFAIVLTRWIPGTRPMQTIGVTVLAEGLTAKEAYRLCGEHNDTIEMLGLPGEQVDVVACPRLLEALRRWGAALEAGLL
jgi:hypothetical protein